MPQWVLPRFAQATYNVSRLGQSVRMNDISCASGSSTRTYFVFGSVSLRISEKTTRLQDVNYESIRYCWMILY